MTADDRAGVASHIAPNRKTYGGKTEQELRRLAIAAPDEIGEGDEADLGTVAFHNAFMAASDDLLGCAYAVEEAHGRLDAAGIPSATGASCGDPTCQTKLGHRVKVVLAELVRVGAALDAAEADKAEWRRQWEIAQAQEGRATLDCMLAWAENGRLKCWARTWKAKAKQLREALFLEQTDPLRGSPESQDEDRMRRLLIRELEKSAALQEENERLRGTLNAIEFQLMGDKDTLDDQSLETLKENAQRVVRRLRAALGGEKL